MLAILTKFWEIVAIWLSDYKVIFGGCLIKSMTSEDLGSIDDANLLQWPQSVQQVEDKYSEAEVVIPGHGRTGSVELMEHTLDLLDN